MGRGPYFSVTKKRKTRFIPRISNKQQAHLRKLDVTKTLDDFFAAKLDKQNKLPHT